MREVSSRVHFGLNRRLTPEQMHVVRGVLIALPLVLVFGLLFSAADAVFANLLRDLFDIEIAIGEDVFGRLVGFVAVGLLSTGALGYAFLRAHSADQSKETKLVDRSVELQIVLGSLNALFLIFIIIQAVYLFGGRDIVLEGELTYAEYGRRGFFELVTVAALTFTLAFYCRSFLHSARTRWPLYLVLALIVQVGVVMISAMKRLSLYEEVFGFTLLRFYSHSFIFFLATAFVLLGFWLVTRRSEVQLLRALFIAAGLYVLALNVVSPDAFVARQNLDRYQETGKIDTAYLGQLSRDAINQQIVLYEQRGHQVDESEKYFASPRDVLCHDQYLARREENYGWSTFNWARAHANERLGQLQLSCSDPPS